MWVYQEGPEAEQSDSRPGEQEGPKSDRRRCDCCGGTYESLVVRRAPTASSEGDTKIVGTWCKGCFMALDLKEAYMTDNYLSTQVSGSARAPSRQTCSTCHEGRFRPAIRGQAVECISCTVRTLANFVRAQGGQRKGPACTWCLRTNCDQANRTDGCAPICHNCKRPCHHHEQGCYLGPPKSQPALGATAGGSLGEGEKPPKHRAQGYCNCRHRASSSLAQISSADETEEGDVIHWLDCPRRKERLYISEAGPALLIEPDEPRGYVE